MEKRTYYMILGVSRHESSQGIRAAYRDLARKLHPDIAGEASTRSFLEVTEAYDVLSDAERRREYNDQLQQAEERAAGGAQVPPLAGLPETLASPLVHDLTSILGCAESIRPSFDAMHARFRRNFTGWGIPKSEQPEGLTFEVLLTPTELRRGCVVPVGVPVFYRCPQCGGSGRDWLYPCTFCQEQGFFEQEEVVSVDVPPMTSPGTVFDIPLHGLGIRNFYLRLYVRLQAE